MREPYIYWVRDSFLIRLQRSFQAKFLMFFFHAGLRSVIHLHLLSNAIYFINTTCWNLGIYSCHNFSVYDENVHQICGFVYKPGSLISLKPNTANFLIMDKFTLYKHIIWKFYKETVVTWSSYLMLFIYVCFVNLLSADLMHYFVHFVFYHLFSLYSAKSRLRY